MAQYNLLGGVNPINPEYEQQQAMLGKGTNWAEYDLRKDALKEQKKANKMNTIFNGINTAFKAFDAYQQSKEFDLQKESQDLINTEREITIQSKRIDLDAKKVAADEDKEYIDGLMKYIEAGDDVGGGAWVMSHPKAANRNADTTWGYINRLRTTQGDAQADRLLSYTLPETAEKIRQFNVGENNANNRAYLAYQGQQLSAASRIQAANIKAQGQVDAQRIKFNTGVIESILGGTGGSVAGYSNVENSEAWKDYEDGTSKVVQSVFRDNPVGNAFAANTGIDVYNKSTTNTFSNIKQMYPDSRIVPYSEYMKVYEDLYGTSDIDYIRKHIQEDDYIQQIETTATGEPRLDPTTKQPVSKPVRRILDSERDIFNMMNTKESKYTSLLALPNANGGTDVIPIDDSTASLWNDTTIKYNRYEDMRKRDMQMLNYKAQQLAAVSPMLKGSSREIGLGMTVLQTQQQQLENQGKAVHNERVFNQKMSPLTDPKTGKPMLDENGNPIMTPLYSEEGVPEGEWGYSQVPTNRGESYNYNDRIRQADTLESAQKQYKAATTKEEQEEIIRQYKLDTNYNTGQGKFAIAKKPDFIKFMAKVAPNIKNTAIVDTALKGMTYNEFVRYLSKLTPEEQKAFVAATDAYVRNQFTASSMKNPNYKFNDNDEEGYTSNYQTNQHQLFNQGMTEYLDRTLASINKGDNLQEGVHKSSDEIENPHIFESDDFFESTRKDMPQFETKNYRHMTEDFLRRFADNLNANLSPEEQIHFRRDNLSAISYGHILQNNTLTLPKDPPKNKTFTRHYRGQLDKALKQIGFLMEKYKNNPTMLELIRNSALEAIQNTRGESTPPVYPNRNSIFGIKTNPNR